ncbi:cysteine dioxygenase family protein [Frankia sp. CiP3]|uniref:cysteine dioxygenase n=1 Tax=Frankia sp. CiP3 TaxID=2880971 RepID=UPI001EF60627|nr:cysteine dioxygenase family protein [Frankia sp. CiP3]
MTTASRSRSRVRTGSRRSPTDAALIVRRLTTHRDGWAPLVRFDPKQRWYTLLETAADHQAWLLTWLPGQSTDLHDHGGSAGAFTVVAGVLTEWAAGFGRCGPSRPETAETHAGGRVRSFGPAHVHRIGNTGTTPAVSIHVYTPALEFMRRYVVDPRAGLVEVGREQAGVDW